MPAIDDGVARGKRIGKYVVSNVVSRKGKGIWNFRKKTLSKIIMLNDFVRKFL